MLKDGNKGITLVALVLTIIILLILAGISISALTNTGIFEKAEEAKRKTEEAENEEQKNLEEYEIAFDENTTVKLVNDKMNKVLSTKKNVKIEDEKGNIFILPAGFKIVVDDTTDNAKTVDKGIVVEDATVNEDGTKTSTNGSQFVWIPVGTVTKLDGTKTEINFNRYAFDREGKTKEYSGLYIEEDESNKESLKEYGNVIAKDISKFKTSVVKNKGFYIGRYEARRNTNGEITEIGTDNVWNNITQPDAANQARDMYDSKYSFTSDLMNSYAWDTSIVFLQNCGDNSKYSQQTSLNIDTLATAGTNMQDIKDFQCNIYDMASNVREWTTETSSDSSKPCIYRGGGYNNLEILTSSRVIYETSYVGKDIGFRILLYL